ncbi:MAG: O-antigen ligase family protein [Flavobacteriales bacterium]|nr:O-antigen ligase family protein [Flavobacteriales bacterium]
MQQFNTASIYLLGLCFVAVGLSLSKPLIGIGQGILGVAWLIEGHHLKKIKSFFSDKTSWILIIYFVVSVLGLVYSKNLSYGIADVKRKLPLFILPFVLYGVPFSSKQLKIVFSCFVGAVLVSSFWSIFVKLGGLGITIVDERNYSRFDSHIRFGLAICLSIFGLGYGLIKEKKTIGKLILIGIIIWLVSFLFIVNFYTGIIILCLSSVFLILFKLSRTKSLGYKFLLLLFPILLVGLFVYYIKTNYQLFHKTHYFIEEKIYSPYGEKYWHDYSSNETENGNFVYRNIAEKELEYSWNKVSTIRFKEKDLKGQPISSTLKRFITSKGEYKNQKAVMNLTYEEVEAIEHGVCNVNNMNLNMFNRRLQDIIWEIENYRKGGNYNGHSIVMRLVFWKTAFSIFKENILFGVGTGDIQDAFNIQYEKDKSILSPKYRLRAHNQFITAFTTFGIFGGILFFVFIFAPFFQLGLKDNFFYIAFFIVMCISMLTEDTLDTQVGITLYVFFNTLLIYNKKNI